MRSRYVAYTQANNDYLLKTWHESTRPKDYLPAEEGVDWRGLTILRTEQGSESDDRGIVEFRAKCRVNGEAAGVDEASETIPVHAVAEKNIKSAAAHSHLNLRHLELRLYDY